MKKILYILSIGFCFAFNIVADQDYPMNESIQLFLEGTHADNTILLEDLMKDESFLLQGKNAKQYKILDGYIHFAQHNLYEFHVSNKKLPPNMKEIIRKEKFGKLTLERFAVVHIPTGEKFKLKELTLNVIEKP